MKSDAGGFASFFPSIVPTQAQLNCKSYMLTPTVFSLTQEDGCTAQHHRSGAQASFPRLRGLSGFRLPVCCRVRFLDHALSLSLLPRYTVRFRLLLHTKALLASERRGVKRFSECPPLSPARARANTPPTGLTESVSPSLPIVTSRIRSASKKRFSSLFSRSSTPSGGSASNMNAASEGPFLHLKFGVGRPPPHEHEHEREDGDGSALLLFAHELASLDPAAHARHLHETLRTDVQRAGIARWLEQNFKEDAYIYDVVHRREGDRGMFALVTKNWARSVGDPVRSLSSGGVLFILAGGPIY